MTFAEAVRYRVGQFLRALTAHQAVSKRRLRRATAILSPEARRLFARQAPQDQRHALDVYEALLEQGHMDEDLLTAALLHDVGKAAVNASPWRRGLFVLTECFAPGAVARRSQRGGGSHRGFLATYASHPQIGARWAKAAGCSTVTVDLISRHEQRVDKSKTERDRLLRALQAADGAN